MRRKGTRESRNRGDLPQLLKFYFLVLEGAVDPEELRFILSPDVRFTRQATQTADGYEVVRKQIEGWLDTVRDTRIDMQRMLDHGDGCVKVDFTVHTSVSNGDALFTVELPVIAMYMIDLDANRITELLEYWAKVPPQARSYQ
jgi:hypothetical protein